MGVNQTLEGGRVRAGRRHGGGGEVWQSSAPLDPELCLGPCGPPWVFDSAPVQELPQNLVDPLWDYILGER